MEKYKSCNDSECGAGALWSGMTPYNSALTEHGQYNKLKFKRKNMDLC